ncbi:MAG: phage major capsid protein, partial [Bacillota bacterium]
DSTGNYLWRGTDDTILGKPVVISNFMPDMAAGNAAVAVGDLSYFWLLERKPLSVRILTEKYMVSSMIGFAAYERIDGVLVRNKAVKVLKMAGTDGNE